MSYRYLSFGVGEGCARVSVSSGETDMRTEHVLMARSAITMYIQYFSKNDFSCGGSTTLPSAVTGGGTRSEGLFEATTAHGTARHNHEGDRCISNACHDLPRARARAEHGTAMDPVFARREVRLR